MPLKKQTFNADEIEIYDEAVVYKRGEYWQMRMWLGKEKKYARFSLRTRNRDTAIDKAKKYYHELMAQQLAGKTYFSKTTKQGVEEYLKQRAQNKPLHQALDMAHAIDENKDEQASKAIQQYSDEFGPSVTGDLVSDYANQQLTNIDPTYDILTPANKSSAI